MQPEQEESSSRGAKELDKQQAIERLLVLAKEFEGSGVTLAELHEASRRELEERANSSEGTEAKP